MGQDPFNVESVSPTAACISRGRSSFPAAFKDKPLPANRQASWFNARGSSGELISTGSAATTTGILTAAEVLFDHGSRFIYCERTTVEFGSV